RGIIGLGLLGGGGAPPGAYRYGTKRERSRPSGLDPPHRYGAPRCFLAISTTFWRSRSRGAEISESDRVGTSSLVLAQAAATTEHPTTSIRLVTLTASATVHVSAR